MAGGVIPASRRVRGTPALHGPAKMPSTATEPGVPRAAHRLPLLAPALWALAGAACAGGAWFAGTAVVFSLLAVTRADFVGVAGVLAPMSLEVAAGGGSRLRSEPREPGGDEEEEVEGMRVEWVLRERVRRWRDPPLARVLPLLVVSAGSLGGAAVLAPSAAALALLAVGALGASLAPVLHDQERRLRALERRVGRGEE
jgi:hypothetical protein